MAYITMNKGRAAQTHNRVTKKKHKPLIRCSGYLSNQQPNIYE